jgi:Uma2 family endonuclease
LVDDARRSSDTPFVDAAVQKVSVGTYLEMDARAEGRLELLNGVVVAMAGASPRHNLIVTNISATLHGELRSGPCMVMSQDQRVRIEATESYVYPDVVVVCDPPLFDESAKPASLRNPSAVVEVLSESTLDHDLGAKLGPYRQIPSVTEVLFVHAETRATTKVTRQDDGSWKLVDGGPGGDVVVAGVTLPLDVIYERTDDLPT